MNKFMLGALLLLFSSLSANATSTTYFSSGLNSEQVSKLPEDGAWRNIVVVEVDDIKAGDIMIINGQFKAANDTDQWAELGYKCMLATDPASLTGTFLNVRGVQNLNPKTYWIGRSDVHYLVPKCDTSFKATKDLAKGYIQFQAYSKTDPAETSYTLTIDSGYGIITVTKERP